MGSASKKRKSQETDCLGNASGTAEEKQKENRRVQTSRSRVFGSPEEEKKIKCQKTLDLNKQMKYNRNNY